MVMMCFYALDVVEPKRTAEGASMRVGYSHTDDGKPNNKQKRNKTMDTKIEHAMKIELWKRCGNDWGDYSKVYAVNAMPKEIVDEGSYWDCCGDNFLHLSTEDGTTVYEDYDRLCDTFLNNIDVDVDSDWEAIYALPVDGWMELVQKYHKVKFTRIANIPKISAENTIRYSDLTNKAKTLIKLYGIPLLREGEVTARNNVYTPKLLKILAKNCEERIKAEGGVVVEVMQFEPIHNADGYTIELTVRAKSIEVLHIALKTLGIVNPSAIELSTTEGEGETIKSVTASLTLNTRLDD